MTPKLENMILRARDTIVRVGIASQQGGVIDTKFKGYIAALGPLLISNGLLPAILIYEKDSKEKEKVSRALRYLLDSPNTGLLSEYLVPTPDNPANRNYRKLREVAEYAIALKLALSLFTLKETPKNDEQAEKAPIA